jgi:hypothetical protein
MILWIYEILLLIIYDISNNEKQWSIDKSSSDMKLLSKEYFNLVNEIVKR